MANQSIPPGDTPLLRLERISKRYDGGTLALHDFSLDVARGSFVSLVGPSGCGKSTLLRVIAGLLQPDAGSTDWTVADTPSATHPIGFVFQEPTLMPWASVFDNVFLPLKLQGTRSATGRDEVMAALEKVKLGGVADALPRQLSGGMKMRVSIARALVARSPVLLMDEPFAALDEFTREQLDDDLLSLWSEFGWTVIFVTHSIYESVYLSQRVVVMGEEPGPLIADIAIAEPYPRRRSFRETPAYFEHCHAVSSALRQGGMVTT